MSQIVVRPAQQGQVLWLIRTPNADVSDVMNIEESIFVATVTSGVNVGASPPVSQLNRMFFTCLERSTSCLLERANISRELLRRVFGRVGVYSLRLISRFFTLAFPLGFFFSSLGPSRFFHGIVNS
jgi:hypothetical protein